MQQIHSYSYAFNQNISLLIALWSIWGDEGMNILIDEIVYF